ncbi:DUF6151 family protein [Ruegeria sp. EL01]|jgi:hypothetical protein|uniref:DUF6151 family protein n=1 Tax=Ruegeria sp. EL01 TaxID=2107578 RepID=UPI000EA825B8|nr:DUF6151 family protein [Ruegeria sp. EL01]
MGKSEKSGLAFACSCGSVQGHIKPDGIKSGTHAECFCSDCRAAQLYFDQPDPAPGPVEILQISPEAIEFHQGTENLAAMQLSPKGMYRWYVTCCNAPVANTFKTPKFPFVGVIVDRIADPAALGPVTSRGSVPQPDGTQKHEKIGSAIFKLFKRAAKSRLTGGWKSTPFFNTETGDPIVTPAVISKCERDALYP